MHVLEWQIFINPTILFLELKFPLVETTWKWDDSITKKNMYNMIVT